MALHGFSVLDSHQALHGGESALLTANGDTDRDGDGYDDSDGSDNVPLQVMVSEVVLEQAGGGRNPGVLLSVQAQGPADQILPRRFVDFEGNSGHESANRTVPSSISHIRGGSVKVSININAWLSLISSNTDVDYGKKNNYYLATIRALLPFAKSTCSRSLRYFSDGSDDNCVSTPRLANETLRRLDLSMFESMGRGKLIPLCLDNDDNLRASGRINRSNILRIKSNVAPRLPARLALVEN